MNEQTIRISQDDAERLEKISDMISVLSRKRIDEQRAVAFLIDMFDHFPHSTLITMTKKLGDTGNR